MPEWRIWFAVWNRLGFLVGEFNSALLQNKPVVQLRQTITNRCTRENWEMIFNPLTSNEAAFVEFTTVDDLLNNRLPQALDELERKRLSSPTRS